MPCGIDAAEARAVGKRIKTSINSGEKNKPKFGFLIGLKTIHFFIYIVIPIRVRGEIYQASTPLRGSETVPFELSARLF